MSGRQRQSSEPRAADTIAYQGRLGLAVAGTASWAAGATAVFTSENGVGAGSLIAAGVACVGLAVAGRWPSRITVSGNELSWENIRETVDSQIEVAEDIGESDSTIRELTVLRDRLDVLERTGSVGEHPAVEYDRAVEAALRRLMPGANLEKAKARSREIADFILDDDGRRVLVETKWRRSVDDAYPGITLPRLFANLPAGARLVVVTNATERATAQARKLVEQKLGPRGALVSWRGVPDDQRLGQALSSFLQDP